MFSRRVLFVGLVLVGLTLPHELQGQLPVGPPPRPVMPPLMYVKIAGPKGMKAVFYRGGAEPESLDTPVVVGIRPGYRIRFGLTDLADFPNRYFFPTLEVRGSLILPLGMMHADFPAALVFTNEDFAKASDHLTVKKAILLERPDRALATTTSRDAPYEITVPPTRDLIEETRHLGIPLVILHMGEREFEPREMLMPPGVILLPGDKSLPAPPLPPFVPAACHPVVDPIHGPMHPSAMMALPDGGDVGLLAGVTRDGKIVGLDATDTIARYVDSIGRKRVACSNRVALCVPRFLLATTESGLASNTVSSGLRGTRIALGGSVVGLVAAADMHRQRVSLEALGSRTRPSGTSTEIGLAVTGRLDGLAQNVVTRIPAGVDVTCPGPLESEPKDGCLKVIKFPDKCGALIGDIITFYVRYTNTGGRPMSDVALADSLHTRYEYVPGSARSDRAATFSTQPNEAGSTILHWEIQGDLAPGAEGIVSFQVRIR